MQRHRFAVLFASFLWIVVGSASHAGPAPFLDAFWKHWGDGKAELATYDLVFPRYGELRRGTAVTIFVTETFSDELRVKADPGRHPESDEFPVMKLNLVQDFPTGIYDYNMMTSVFIALAPWGQDAAGSVAKVSFSSQEWCGHVFHQMLPRKRSVESELHSYFDGEADRRESLARPAGGFFEDALFHWARGLAAPFLAPGESRTVPFLGSAEIARLKHVPVAWGSATLARAALPGEITVPAGSFGVETWTAEVEGGSRWTFFVEIAKPHRIVRWEHSGGKRADLVASDRLPYWQLHGNENIDTLEGLGLSPRPPRTP